MRNLLIATASAFALIPAASAFAQIGDETMGPLTVEESDLGDDNFNPDVDTSVDTAGEEIEARQDEVFSTEDAASVDSDDAFEDEADDTEGDSVADDEGYDENEPSELGESVDVY